tara:strand:+ start:621 stop:794 length:174 start_codon:yes stop_codon:yes gene_type:complete
MKIKFIIILSITSIPVKSFIINREIFMGGGKMMLRLISKQIHLKHSALTYLERKNEN